MDGSDSMNISFKGDFKGHKSMVFSICRFRAGNGFWSTGADGYVVGWENKLYAQDAKVNALIDTGQANLTVFADPDSDSLLIGTLNGRIFVVDSVEKKLLFNKKLTSGGIFAIKKTELGYFFVGDNGCLSHLSSDDFKLKRLVQVSSGRCRALCHDHESIFVGTSEGIIHQIDPYRMTVLNRSANLHSGSIFHLIKDEKFIYSAGADGKIIKWNKDLTMIDSIQAHNTTINSLVLVGNEKLLVSACRDGSIRIWDKDSFDLVKVIDVFLHNGHLRSVNCLMWDDTTNNLYSGSDDRNIKNWVIE